MIIGKPEMRGDRILEKTVKESLYTLRYKRHKLLHHFLEPLIYGEPLYDRPCSVKLDFYRARPSYDLDNLVKQTLDLLKDANILPDDEKVFNIEATIHEGSKDEYFVVEIFEWCGKQIG